MALSHQDRVLGLETELFQSLCEGIGSARALACSLMHRHGMYAELMDLSINPGNYDNPAKFAGDYLATSVLQKNPRIPLGIDRAQVAIRKFHQAEEACAESNLRLLKFREDPHSAGLEMIQLVPQIQWIINRILHSHPSRSDLNECERSMRFGPGATTSCSGVVTQGRKFSKRILDCTPNLVPFRAFCFPELWRQSVPELNIRDYSKLTTVPKNAKTDRVICIEPDLNIFVQLGIGAVLRSKLRKFGLDLDTQEVNRAMAARAYRDNLCTVDLSAASDTICTEAVHLLLPPSWVELLALPRAPATQLPSGEIVKLEKWSSMGNGYTFELESLIFYAVALSVTPFEDWGDVTVFGDDIILPEASYPMLVSALSFLGFKVNREKTFGKGLFHESCGTDWFMGVNVRPFFFRSESHDYPSICYLYANNARRWGSRLNGGYTCDGRMLPLWLRCFTAVKPIYRHHIPEGFGDGGFISDFDRACPRTNTRARRRTSWGGYFFFYRRISMRRSCWSTAGALIASLSRGDPSQWTLGNEDLRGRPTAARRKLGYSREWPNLGPWL